MGEIVKKAYKDQHNGNFPTTPPTYLGRIAKAMWRRVLPVLEQQSVIERIDANLVENYCSAYEIYREAYESIKKDGVQQAIYRSVQNSAGDVVGKDFMGYKRNPATAIYNDASKQMTAIGIQLGLSPKSRADLATIKAPDKKLDVVAEMKKFLGGDVR